MYIGHIKLTLREIDVLSCIMSGKSVKVIASILDITPKTIEAHIYNIKKKLTCNAKEHLITQIEKSGSYQLFKNHYHTIILNHFMLKVLGEIFPILEYKCYSCLLIFSKDYKYITELIGYHLSKTGYKTTISFFEEIEKSKNTFLIQDGKKINYIFHFCDQVTLSLLQDLETCKDAQLWNLAHFFEINKLFLGIADNTNNSVNFKIYQNFFINFLLFINNDPKISEILSNYTQTLNTHENLLSLNLENSNSTYIASHIEDDNCKIVSQNTNNLKENKLNGKKINFYILKIYLKSSKNLKIFFIFLSFFTLLYVLIFNNYQNKITNTYLFNNKEKRFVERSKIYQQIQASFSGQEAIEVMALIGIGGSGKTTLARKFAQNSDASLVWEIQSDSKEKIIASFYNLALALLKTDNDHRILHSIMELKVPDQKENKLCIFVREKLKNFSKWILIYDNVLNFSIIQKFFPMNDFEWGTGKVIITSRDSHILHNKHIKRNIFMSPMTEEECFNLFISIINHDEIIKINAEKMEDYKKLIKVIPPFPLDISLAAHYIKSTNIPLAQYKNNILKNDDAFLDFQESLSKEISGYEHSRYRIISSSIEKLLETNKEFLKPLIFICSIGPKRITREILDIIAPSIIIDNLIYNLKKYSIISNEGNNNSYINIHPSTQALGLAYLNKKYSSLNSYNLVEISSKLINYAENVASEENFEKIATMIEHLEAFSSHNNIINENVRSLLRCEVGYMYFLIGNAQKAKNFLETSLSYFDAYPNQKKKNITKLLSYLAIVYRDLGYHKQSHALFKQCIEIYNANKIKDVYKHAWLLTYLAISERELGNFSRAQELLEFSLKSFDSVSNAHELKKAWTLAHLGIVVRELGEYKKAKLLFQESYKIYQNKLGDTHLKSAWVLAHLGIIERELGNFNVSKNNLLKSLSIYNKILDKSHVYIGWILGNIGIIEYELGNFHCAKNFLEKCIKIYKSKTADNIYYISWYSSHLALAENKLNNHKLAYKLINEAYNLLLTQYHKEHIRVARILYYKGIIFYDNGQIEMAHEYFLKALPIFKDYNHPEQFHCYLMLTDVTKNLSQNTKYIHYNKDLMEKSMTYLKLAKIACDKFFPKNGIYASQISKKII